MRLVVPNLEGNKTACSLAKLIASVKSYMTHKRVGKMFTTRHCINNIAQYVSETLPLLKLGDKKEAMGGGGGLLKGDIL